MANSGKPKFADLAEVVAEQLQPALGPERRVLLGLSGGMDSVVLLHILWRLRSPMQLKLHALYVHHGLSPHAGDWGRFCAERCAGLEVPFSMVAVDLRAHLHHGLEGAARLARYQALRGQGAEAVLLGHHQDDQAETLLLQLMRGAGAKGLASMPAIRRLGADGPVLLRPLLQVPRDAIQSYALSCGLRWIEDESNRDLRLKRNFLRARVLPVLEEGFPGARASIAASARHLLDASRLLDDIADADLAPLVREEGLQVAGLIALGEARAGNALRRWCELKAVATPGNARLAEALRQFAIARPDSRTELVLGDAHLRLWQGLLHRIPSTAAGSYSIQWQGEPVMALPGGCGTVRFDLRQGQGIHAALLEQAPPLVLRNREGGEALQPDCRRPRRALKKLFQDHQIPPWRRTQIPFVWHGQELVAVPGIGTDCRWQARTGQPGWVISWEPESLAEEAFR